MLFNKKIDINSVSNFDQDKLYYLITRRHKLINHFLVASQELELPSELIERLKKYQIEQKKRALLQFGELINLKKLFPNINFLVLKGVPLSEELYQDMSFRDSIDIDILVKNIHEVHEISNALINFGFERKYPVKIKNYNYHVKLKSKKIGIEVHWKPSIISRAYIQEICSSHKEIFIQGHVFKTPGDIENFIYLLIHNGKHKWHRISWLIDSISLYDKFTSEQLETMEIIIKERKLDKYYKLFLNLKSSFIEDSNHSSNYFCRKSIKAINSNNIENLTLRSKISFNLFWFKLNKGFRDKSYFIKLSILRIFNNRN